METPEIRVSLTDTRPEDAKNDGKPYCAIVFDWSQKTGAWFNTGIVHWSQSPNEAYLLAYQEVKNEDPGTG